MANRSILVFVVFMIHALAEAWHVSPQKVYAILNKSQVLDKYLIAHYDVLHTLGKEYLVEDVTGCIKDWGYDIEISAFRGTSPAPPLAAQPPPTRHSRPRSAVGGNAKQAL